MEVIVAQLVEWSMENKRYGSETRFARAPTAPHIINNRHWIFSFKVIVFYIKLTTLFKFLILWNFKKYRPIMVNF